MRTPHARFILRAALLCAALAILLPSSVPAAQKIIRPMQLTPASSQQADTQVVFGAAGSAVSSAGYWYPVKLPVGTAITGLQYQHAANPAGTTLVALIRVKPDAAEPFEFLYLGGSNAATATHFEYTTVNAIASPTVDKVVTAGYRYFITVVCQNATTYVGKVKILY